MVRAAEKHASDLAEVREVGSSRLCEMKAEVERHRRIAAESMEMREGQMASTRGMRRRCSNPMQSVTSTPLPRHVLSPPITLTLGA